ncbi:RimK family alpha-L-glutamate ligase [Kitasatospora sp. NPDC086009]|uniref:ATP-grasp domain-containing protein n=1 Tax=unclassified Kitasatospora TaxID=2633591 RepID=UPI0037C8143C
MVLTETMMPLLLVTDHGSKEGSREILADAIARVTGQGPVRLDARLLYDDGPVTAGLERAGGLLTVRRPGRAPVAVEPVVVVFEIPPHRRRHLEGFQDLLRRFGARTLAADPEAWRVATDKSLMVERFSRDSVAQMETLRMNGSWHDMLSAFHRLGRDVWARPALGMGGADVFHVTGTEQLKAAAAFYRSTGQGWLISRDAGNFTADGRRNQHRVIVLNGKVVHAFERHQSDPDRPCNVSQGAGTTVLGPDRLPPRLAELAVAATASVGLPFAGVDLAAQSGGVVFEVNVHPAFNPDRPVETVAIPYVRAHLSADPDLTSNGAGRRGDRRPA